MVDKEYEFDITFPPRQEPYKVDNYKPTDDEHKFVNKIAHMRKLLCGFILDSFNVETKPWLEQSCVIDNAGLYYSNNMYSGLMTVEMVDECFKAVNTPQNPSLIAQFVSAFNHFVQEEQLEVNNFLIALLLTFMKHEVGGLASRREIKSGNQSYWQPAGPYHQIYCGRGQIQITWEYTYLALENYFRSKPGFSQYHPYSDPDILVRNIEAATASTLWFIFVYKGKQLYPAMFRGDVYTATGYVCGAGVWSNSAYSSYIPARQRTYDIFLPIVTKHIQ